MLPDVWSNEYTFPAVVPISKIPPSVDGGVETVSPSGNVNVHAFEPVAESSAYTFEPVAKNTASRLPPPPKAGEYPPPMLDDHIKFRLLSNTVTLFADATATFPLAIDTAGDVLVESPAVFERLARRLYIAPLDVNMYSCP
jgi:hypothetical protein